MEHVDEPLVVMAEIKRVTKPGGLIVIGMPGFRRVAFEKVQGKLKKILPRFLHNPLLTFTIVYQRHDEPVDNWRPSLRCVREVFMKGLENVEVWSVMMPPRLIGVGFKAVRMAHNEQQRTGL
jgi:SAM-dependent methyltransferase